MAFTLSSQQFITKEKSINMLEDNQMRIADQFIKAYNNLAVNDPSQRCKALPAVKSDDLVSAYAEFKSKAITGATAVTGNALVGQTFAPISLDLIAIEMGDVFRSSGVYFEANVRGQKTFPAFQGFGKFTKVTPGTSVTNDIAVNVGVNNPVNPAQYQAEIPLYNEPSLTAYQGNIGAMFGVFEQVLEVQKGYLADDLMAEAITTNPTGITALDSTGATTYFPIVNKIQELVNKFSKYGPVKVWMNHYALTKVMTEQSSTGDLSNTSLAGLGNGRLIIGNNGIIPKAGLVGYMCGAEVWLVPAIKSTYTVGASNAVTAQTGGTKTVIVVGIARALGTVRGVAENDFVTVFDPKNSRDNFRDATTTIGAYTYSGSSVLNPYMVGYYAI